MRVWWGFVGVVGLTLLAGVLLSGDGAGSGQTVLSFGGGHGVNRNDLPVVALWTVGAVATACLLARRGTGARLAAAWIAVAAVTCLLVMLLFGLGPGAEEIRLSVARRHGLNPRGLTVTLVWAVTVYGILRLKSDDR